MHKHIEAHTSERTDCGVGLHALAALIAGGDGIRGSTVTSDDGGRRLTDWAPWVCLPVVVLLASNFLSRLHNSLGLIAAVLPLPLPTGSPPPWVPIRPPI